MPDCSRLRSLEAIFISVFDLLGDCSDCGTSTGTSTGTDTGIDALATLNTRVLAVGAGKGSGKD